MYTDMTSCNNVGDLSYANARGAKVTNTSMCMDQTTNYTILNHRSNGLQTRPLLHHRFKTVTPISNKQAALLGTLHLLAYMTKCRNCQQSLKVHIRQTLTIRACRRQALWGSDRTLSSLKVSMHATHVCMSQHTIHFRLEWVCSPL